MNSSDKVYTAQWKWVSPRRNHFTTIATRLIYDNRRISGNQKLIIGYKHIMSSLDILSCRPCLLLNGVIYVRNNYEYFVSRRRHQKNRCPFIIFWYKMAGRFTVTTLQLVTCTMMIMIFPSTLRITCPR